MNTLPRKISIQHTIVHENNSQWWGKSHKSMNDDPSSLGAVILSGQLCNCWMFWSTYALPYISL